MWWNTKFLLNNHNLTTRIENTKNTFVLHVCLFYNSHYHISCHKALDASHIPTPQVDNNHNDEMFNVGFGAAADIS